MYNRHDMIENLQLALSPRVRLSRRETFDD
jgi:hypothetical protein